MIKEITIDQAIEGGKIIVDDVSYEADAKEILYAAAVLNGAADYIVVNGWCQGARNSLAVNIAIASWILGMSGTAMMEKVIEPFVEKYRPSNEFNERFIIDDVLGDHDGFATAVERIDVVDSYRSNWACNNIHKMKYLEQCHDVKFELPFKHLIDWYGIDAGTFAGRGAELTSPIKIVESED